jgi:hypothetical protein
MAVLHDLCMTAFLKATLDGPLIKSSPSDQTKQTQEHVSEQKNKELG